MVLGRRASTYLFPFQLRGLFLLTQDVLSARTPFLESGGIYGSSLGLHGSAAASFLSRKRPSDPHSALFCLRRTHVSSMFSLAYEMAVLVPGDFPHGTQRIARHGLVRLIFHLPPLNGQGAGGPYWMSPPPPPAHRSGPPLTVRYPSSARPHRRAGCPLLVARPS